MDEKYVHQLQGGAEIMGLDYGDDALSAEHGVSLSDERDRHYDAGEDKNLMMDVDNELLANRPIPRGDADDGVCDVKEEICLDDGGEGALSTIEDNQRTTNGSIVLSNHQVGLSCNNQHSAALVDPFPERDDHVHNDPLVKREGDDPLEYNLEYNMEDDQFKVEDDETCGLENSFVSENSYSEGGNLSTPHVNLGTNSGECGRERLAVSLSVVEANSPWEKVCDVNDLYASKSQKKAHGVSQSKEPFESVDEEIASKPLRGPDDQDRPGGAIELLAKDSSSMMPREAGKRVKPKGRPRGTKNKRPKERGQAGTLRAGLEEEKPDLTEDQRNDKITSIWEECSKKIDQSRMLHEETEWLNPETGLVELKTARGTKQLEKNDFYRKFHKTCERQKEKKKQILESGQLSTEDLVFLNNLPLALGNRKRRIKMTTAQNMKCRICDQVLTRFKFNHAFLCHGMEYRDACAVCLERDFPSLEQHYRVTHWGDAPLKCHLCSEVHYSAKALQSHIVSHTTVDPLKCPVKICQLAFSTEAELEEHRKAVHNPRLSKDNIKRKKSDKSERCEVACEICGQMVPCKSRSVVDTRMQWHRKRFHDVDKQLKCPYPSCDKRFVDYSRLSVHCKQAHTPEGERPFVCRFENCNKTFKTSYHLRTHTTYHRPPKFQCDKCQQKFYWPQPLKLHKCAATLARRMRANRDEADIPETEN